MTDQSGSEHGRWVRSAVDRYEGSLVRYALRLTGDVQRARDVVQDTFLRLCREDRASLDGHLAEWLFTVCRNRSLDVCRKEKRMKTLSPQMAAAQVSRDDPPAAAETRDTSRHVARLLEDLSDNQQEVLRLKFQSGLSYREIAGVTKLSVGNVGYLIHTALAKLRTQLGEEFTSP